MGAHVTVFDVNINKLREVDAEFGGRIETRYCSMLDLEDAVKQADLVIGAVLVPGAKAPKLVTNSTVAHMKSGAVLVDIAIDQGGCFEDSRPTTHDDPTFAVHDTVFYCVANMPGAVPRTSTYALTNATMPYLLKLADKGWQAACQADPALAKGLSTHEGALLSEQVASDLGSPTPIRLPCWPDPAGCYISFHRIGSGVAPRHTTTPRLRGLRRDRQLRRLTPSPLRMPSIHRFRHHVGSG